MALPPLRHLAVIILCAALCLLPAFLLGAGGSDLHCQSLYVKQFTMQLRGGEFYPRWLQDMFAGDGSPVFFYYPPLTYFMTSVFYFLIPLDPFGYYPMAASAFLATLIAAITFYIWLKEETGNDRAALLGCLLYILSPVNLTQNFYYLLLFSSVWAYAWIPLLMLFAKRLAKGRAYAVPGFAFSLSLLVLTNIPLTLIFAPLACAYSFIHCDRSNIGRKAVLLSSAVLLGFSLSAAYLLPSLLYTDFANIDLFWTRTALVRKPYLSHLHTPSDWLYTVYGVVSALLAIIYFRFTPASYTRLFFFILILGSLFMMEPFSKPFWDWVPLISKIQMSERLFSAVALCLAFFAGITWLRLRWLGIALLLAYLCILIAVAFNTRTTIDHFRKEEPARYRAYTLNIEQYAIYLSTHDLFNRYGTPEGVDDIMKHREQVRVLKGDAQVLATQWQPRNITLHYDVLKPSSVLIRQFDFPGWRAFAGDSELNITRNNDTGQIQLDIPEGTGDIHLKLMPLLPEIAGKMISMISAALLLLLLLLSAKRHDRNKALANNT